MHREEFIADNMIKVGYAKILADWRSADQLIVRTLAAFVCTHMLHDDLLVKLCRSSCY